MTTSVKIFGNYSYDVSPFLNDVSIYVDTILNTSSTASTGTIRLELWLTQSAWNSNGSNTGWEIATDRITGSSNGTLPPNTQFNNISAVVPYLNHPPAGTYYVTLAVAEYTGSNLAVDDGYVIDTSSGFSNYLVVGTDGSLSQGGPVPSVPPPPTYTYTLTHDSHASVTEGETENFTLQTSNLAAGTTLYYSLSGVTNSEVVGGSLSGTLRVGSDGTASLPVTLTSAPGQGLSGTLTATISTAPDGLAVANASEPLTETPVQTGPASGGIHPSVGSVIAKPGQSLNVNSIFSINAGSNAPLYIDLTILDRNEYPGVDANFTNYFNNDTLNNSLTGHLAINGALISNKPLVANSFLSGSSADTYEESMCFSYIPSTGKYYNSTYGYLDQLQINVSSRQYENAYVTIYGSNDPAILSTVSPININSPGYSENLVNTVPLSSYFSGLGNYQYCGTIDLITRADLPAAPTTQATPNGICTSANSFIGKTWSDVGCWTLASNISAQSGASLDPQSAYVPSASDSVVPTSNGEWLLVYYGGAQSNPSIASAEAMARPGDIVLTGWTAGGGHITTVVSGYGTQAQVVDNIELLGANSTIVNSANDGISSDIVIQPAHSLDTMLQGNGATPSTIAIYRLDTPTITTNATTVSVKAGSTLALSQLFSTTDAGGAGNRPIVSYAIYDAGIAGGVADQISVNGAAHNAQSPASQIDFNANSLSSLALAAGDNAGTDTIWLSAYNGAYWGDWAPISINILGNYTAAYAVYSFTNGTLPSTISISDTAADVGSSLDVLESLTQGKKVSSIALTDPGVPGMTITAAQAANDAAALGQISGNYTLTVQFSGTASQYAVTTTSGSVAINGNGISESLKNVAALQFSDVTEIIAAAPGPANAVTTGNITELYSAVLAREPDVGGLAFYQNFLKANPNTPLATFATYFLSSSEYASAHSYAQSTTGDTNFINDSYQNLLHRTPSASEVAFYETNVLAPAVANLTPGTPAYASAQLAAHAQMLVYFSASSEFLSAVQITASNPASASHWLLLA